MSNRAERGFKFFVLTNATDSTNKRFPSAVSASDNESAAGDGVSPEGGRVIIESVQTLTQVDETVSIQDGSAAGGGYFDIFVSGAGPAKLLGVTLHNGLGATLAGTSGSSVIIAYTPVS